MGLVYLVLFHSTSPFASISHTQPPNETPGQPYSARNPLRQMLSKVPGTPGLGTPRPRAKALTSPSSISPETPVGRALTGKGGRGEAIPPALAAKPSLSSVPLMLTTSVFLGALSGLALHRLSGIPKDKTCLLSPYSLSVLSPVCGVPRSCPSLSVPMTFTLSLGTPETHGFPSHPNSRHPHCLFPAQDLLPSSDGDFYPWLNLGWEEHIFYLIHP